jgi:hypothetical protein
MHPGAYRRIVLALTGLLAACGASKQPAVVVELPAGRDTVLSSYGEVSEAVWLGGKRWAALALPDETVAIIDFGRDAAAPISSLSKTPFISPTGDFAG